MKLLTTVASAAMLLSGAAKAQDAFLDARFFGAYTFEGERVANPISTYTFSFSGVDGIIRCHAMARDEENNPIHDGAVDVLTQWDAMLNPTHRRDALIMECNKNSLK